MKFLSLHWCDLQWSQWIPFSNPSAFRNLPPYPGMYRIRAVNGNELFYLGETGRNLRERLGDLRRNTMKETMPYNDPHTAAPSLWAWRHAEGIEFECSVAPVALTDNQEEARKLREGLEFYLLWQYRLEFGASTRCNHGRFHPRYQKSTDRKRGLQGYRLPETTADNPAGGPSLPPLSLIATPFDGRWMSLSWSPFHPLIKDRLNNTPTTPGVYKIVDVEQREVLYIGETGDLYQRLRVHQQKSWGSAYPYFSYVTLPADTPSYQRHEIENDLIGGFYAQTKRIPKFQLMDHK
jgi:hypothetical protein